MSKFMNRPPPTMSTATLTSSSTYVEKLMIGLDHAPPAFDLRTQIIGVGGANLIYIRNETGAVATLRGRGSMFIDPALGIESPEPMHLYIEHTRLDALQNAKQLARNLIETLQQELAHFQQINPPGSAGPPAPVQSIQYSQQPVQSLQPTHTQVIPQMSVPPPMLKFPPPSMQNVEQISTVTAPIVQQSNIVTQNTPTMVTATPVQTVTAAAPPHNQPQIIQQQIIPGNMVIQQPVQQTGLPTNLNVPPPPPNMSIKQGHIVPSPVQLSQPPPNIQLQQQPTQIVLNQPQTNYQYIQQTTADASGQQQNVTIQHIYQPQGLVQQTAPISSFQTQPTTVRPPTQQYIVQGNTAYPCITAVPPPNIIQHQPPPMQPVQTQQPIIFQTTTNPPASIPLQQLQFHPPPNLVETQSNGMQPPPQMPSNGNDANTELNANPVKDEKSSPEPNESASKNDEHGDAEQAIEQIENMPSNGPNISMQVPPPIRFASAPIMAVPPPMSCVQHIVGNTIITSTQPTAPQTHQIYNPVSLQQIQAPPPGQQQIHVSSSGQHFLVNTQYPQQTFQQVPQNVQSFQLTAAPQARSGPNEIVMVSNQAILAPSVNQSTAAQQQTRIFNPHMAPPTVTGMSVQFQPVMQSQVVESQQILEQSQPQPNFQQQIQQINQTIQAPMQQQTMQQQMSATLVQQTMPQTVTDATQKLNGVPYSVQNVPQPVPYPPQLEEQRIGMKRKRNGDDDQGPPKHLMPPRMGMGSNNGGAQQQTQHFATINTTSTSLSLAPTSATVTTTNTQDESLPSSSVHNFVHFNQRMGNDSEPRQQFETRTVYYRMPVNTSASPSIMQSNAPIMMSGMPPRGPPRFNANNNSGNFQMHHRLNFGPPPPPPPIPSQAQRPRFTNR